MSVQIITQNDKPEWAVVPYETYLQLIEQSELLEDIQDYDRIKSGLENGTEETIPAEVVYAILDGANALKVWREYRGLSQQETAKLAGISVPYLSQLEGGKRKGSVGVLSKLAQALKVDIELLLS